MAVETPLGSSRLGGVVAELIVVVGVVVGLPVARGVAEVLACFLDWVKAFLSSSGGIILSSSGVCKEMWLMVQLVLDQEVGALGWHLVVAGLDIASEFVGVVTVETLVVSEAFGTVWLLSCGVLVVVSFESGLSRLETGARFVTAWMKVRVRGRFEFELWLLTRMI